MKPRKRQNELWRIGRSFGRSDYDSLPPDAPAMRPAPHNRMRLEPRLVPLFPIGPLTPSSQCPHRGPIARDSLLCCMVCNQSGLDYLRSFRPSPPFIETRRERRRRLRQAQLTVYLSRRTHHVNAEIRLDTRPPRPA